MKHLLLLAACVSFTSLAISADEPAVKIDKFYLVEVSDFCGTEAVEAMSSAEYKNVGDEIKLESRLFAKALLLTEKEWRADESTKSKPFPRAAIKPREMKLLDQSTTKKAIDAKLSALEEKKADKEHAKEDREAKRAKDKEARNKSVSNRNDDKKGKDDRDIMEARAISLFKGQIEALKVPPVPVKPEAAKPEAEKAEKAAVPPVKP